MDAGEQDRPRSAACERVTWHPDAVTFDLTAFGPRIQDHSDEWNSLGLDWNVGPIHLNLSKASTSAGFDGAERLAQIIIWETDECDLDTVRKKDDQTVNKHYDVHSVTDLDTVIDEVLRLLRDGVTPPGAFIP